MIAAVFDAMVFLQAIANNDGPAAACLRFVESGDVRLLLAPDVLRELRDVLLRPSTRRRFPRVTDEKVELFLAKITALAVVLDDVPATVEIARDPKDAIYVNLAIAGNASCLVSRDKDLLSLMDDAVFPAQYPAISIVDPVTFLQRVRAEAGAEPS